MSSPRPFFFRHMGSLARVFAVAALLVLGTTAFSQNEEDVNSANTSTEEPLESTNAADPPNEAELVSGVDAGPESEPGSDAEGQPPLGETDSSSSETTPDSPESGAAPDAAAEAEPDSPSPEGAAPDDGSTGEETDAEATTAGLKVLALVLVIIVGAPLVGGWLAKRLRMESHGWKISLALGTISAAAMVIAFGEFRQGVDLAGGVTLIYQVDTDRLNASDGEDVEANVPTVNVPMQDLIAALTRRINPSGTKEISIRPVGETQVEIIVPKATPAERERLKEVLTNLGELEFRITAKQQDPRYADLVTAAQKLPKDQKDLVVDGAVKARWVKYDPEEFGAVDSPDPDPRRQSVKRIGTDRRGQDVPELLAIIDDLNVTGRFLDRTWAGTDELLRPAVHFTFNSEGAARFGRLTGAHAFNETTGEYRHLGIMLNGQMVSAPSIRTRIDGQGIIEGDFTEEEVNSLVGVLNAGSLPAALNKTPLSEETISPTIGLATVKQGTYAIAASLLLVLVFMAVYYWFAGLVACFALLANLVLVIGTMILFKAAFTLPGLAGLVLTVGMSVDANVLIFERIREELARGSGLRLAIRNGFEKARTTIVDANITTGLTGVVLFAIGTDQIKGFATTLIIGILMSMYTAIFCSRIIFDIAERRRWISELKMMRIVGKTNIDFIGKKGLAAVLSLALISVGMVSVFQRGADMLNIDFTGGVSVTMVLNEASATSQEEVRTRLSATELGDRNLAVVELGTGGTRYTISARYDKEELDEGNAILTVQEVIKETFKDQLETYSVEIKDLQAVNSATDEADSDAETESTPHTSAVLVFKEPVDWDTVADELDSAIAESNAGQNVGYVLTNPQYVTGSAERFENWNVNLGLPVEAAESLLTGYADKLNSSPIFPLANRIGSRVAGKMQRLAALAIFFSLVCIVGYLWIRFQRVSYGLAAVVALVHDVLFTVGIIGVSSWLVQYASPVADLLLVEPFQISLPIVAALLTIIGYSLNDTIVVFDRIREVKGKSPSLTKEMVNTSINQTLSRTLLTSLTTLIVVSILYFFGGPGIHGFAFCLVIGVLVGTYSSIFVASPTLLWMSQMGSSDENGGNGK